MKSVQSFFLIVNQEKNYLNFYLYAGWEARYFIGDHYFVFCFVFYNLFMYFFLLATLKVFLFLYPSICVVLFIVI